MQITAGTEHIKVPGRVVVSERESGAAVVWIDPGDPSIDRAIDPGCAARIVSGPGLSRTTVTAITASMFGGKEVSDGAVTRVTTQAIFSEVRIGSDSAGGPVFAESGALAGISAIDDKQDVRRWNDAWVVPIERACGAIAAALQKTTGVTPPPATRLPLEPVAAKTRPITIVKSGAAAKSPRQTAPKISAADFDLTFLTPTLARDLEADARGDFGTWTDYVRDAEPVLLVRVSPQFEESMWKMLARGAAATQGMALPPLKSFTANFLQLRAYCGDAEVTPIHPFIIEHQAAERAPVREGLYVFAIDAFGPQCASVRFSMFSEKDPKNADTKAIDPKLFEQLVRAVKLSEVRIRCGSSRLQYRAGMTEPVIVPRAEHPISRRDIDSDALKVLYRLHESGAVAYLVGGSVRDLLLSRRPKDFDIGTSAHPYQVKKLFRNCWIIGRRFRLAHVRFGLKTIEVATFRKNIPAGSESEPA